MAIVQPEMLTGFNFFVEGAGYGGIIKSLPLPTLEFEKDEFQSGGMNAPVDVETGLKPIRLDDVLLAEPSPTILKTFGRHEVDGVGLRCQGSYKAPTSSTEKQLVCTFRGKWYKQSHEKFEAKSLGGLNLSASLVYYKYEYGGAIIHEIDVLNNIYVVDGVDRWQQRRQNLGL